MYKTFYYRKKLCLKLLYIRKLMYTSLYDFYYKKLCIQLLYIGKVMGKSLEHPYPITASLLYPPDLTNHVFYP
jgi:hypothetical protein